MKARLLWLAIGFGLSLSAAVHAQDQAGGETRAQVKSELAAAKVDGTVPFGDLDKTKDQTTKVKKAAKPKKAHGLDLREYHPRKKKAAAQ
jgi:hypothetical protein